MWAVVCLRSDCSLLEGRSRKGRSRRCRLGDRCAVTAVCAAGSWQSSEVGSAAPVGQPSVCPYLTGDMCHVRVDALRYGLCGPNGVGKSTLMRAIANGQVDGFPPADELRTVYVEHDIQASLADLNVVDFVFADPLLHSGGESIASLWGKWGAGGSFGGGERVYIYMSTQPGRPYMSTRWTLLSCWPQRGTRCTAAALSRLFAPGLISSCWPVQLPYV
jgi:hypothetical protein